ncbi:MAG: hypothetical protein AB1641_00995 [Thermodesulfobacteriota bacterium]
MAPFGIDSLAAQAGRGIDPTYAEGVRKGFEGSGILAGLHTLIPILLVLLGVILLLLLLRLLFRPTRIRFGRIPTEQITDPDKIRDIIKKSIDLRALYDLEVFHPDYKQIYKGQVLGLNQDGDLEMELGSYTDPNLDFQDQEARVAFGVSRRGQKEFYQFETFARGLGYTKALGLKQRVVVLSPPRTISLGQKRRYLRVSPSGQFAFKAEFLEPAMVGNRFLLNAFRRLHEVEVLDVGIGGLQAILKARSNELRIRPGQEVYLHFHLPLAGLKIQNVPEEIRARGKIISIERLATGRRVMSRIMDEQTVGPHLIRVQFTGRGYLDARKKTVLFRPVTLMGFEDLSRWVQAFQRYRIQREKAARAISEPTT